MCIVILKKVSALVTSIAVIATLVGCSNAPAPLTTSTPAPAPITTLPSDASTTLDEWDNWTADAVPRDEIKDALAFVADSIGVEELIVPGQAYLDIGWVSVAKLETRCIVAVAFGDSYPAQPNLSISILSRYNLDAQVDAANVTFAETKTILDHYRGWCLGDELPPYLDLHPQTETS